MIRWLWIHCISLLLLLCTVTTARADEIRVCVRPPGVSKDVGRWAFSNGSALMTADGEVFAANTHGLTVYVYDPSAPPESARLLPIPHNRLKCAARVLPAAEAQPKKEAAPRKEKAASKKDDAGEGNGAPGKKAEAAQGTPKPIERPKEEKAEALGPRTKKPALEKREVTTVGPAPDKRPPTVLPHVTKSRKPTPMVAACGKCQGKGKGNKPGVEKTALDKFAEELAIAGAMANGQLNEDLKRADGKRYGIPGGRNPYGPNSRATQLMAGGILVTAAVLSQTRAFEKMLRDAIKKKAPLFIKSVAELSEEAAELLAKKWGTKITWALEQNGAIGPYRVMKKFTEGQGGAYQAHHILERRVMRDLNLGDPELAPSVILTEAERKSITAKLAKATRDIKDLKRLWAEYQGVYSKHPEWLKAIESYFVKGR